MTPTLASIHRYPLKSGAGQSLPQALLQRRGLQHDRRWMVIDANGRFISARTHPQLVRVSALVGEDGHLQLQYPGLPALRVALPGPDAEQVSATVWSSCVQVPLCGDAAAHWLQQVLGEPARLVHMDDSVQRAVDPDYGQPGDEVSFADGFPLLLLSEAALQQLNHRSGHSLDLRRFRPNLVVAGTEPHAEDRWRRIRIGDIEFVLPKPCVRCVLTTVDPDLGSKDPTGEPLTSLKHYRRTPKGITFGMNVIAHGEGMLRVGMPVQVLETD